MVKEIMKKQKCSLELYTNFLIASQNRYSCVELSRVSPVSMSHDSVSRWLACSEFVPSDLWCHVEELVDVRTGYLLCDDTLLVKKYSRVNELAKVQYSGNEHGLVNGICLVNLLWTTGDEFIPIDYRIYQKKNDNKTKNDHFKDMLRIAKDKGFSPLYILMDSWYSSIDNFKLIRKFNWNFICNLKSNRKISVSQGKYIHIADLDLADKQVRRVWLREYGYILVCKIVDKNGDIRYLATNDLTLTDYEKFTGHFRHRWKIEEFHRCIKQTTGIEKCYSTKASSQKTHIFTSFIAFIKLEITRLKEHISWYEQKNNITRTAVTNYIRVNA